MNTLLSSLLPITLTLGILCLFIWIITSYNKEYKAIRKRNEEEMKVLINFRDRSNQELTQELSKIQREYYELGWKEKSSKKVRKRTYFGGYFSI